ncbi:unnamed protein product [Hermetia illucens]|uniref:GH16 domain-containing protein n=1 Tax=Hermetia illucens TaxID=343691 RepID=A0A7R8UXR9_HERIL|nr:beta-1,3-glucan-binding protein-like [Hermetia illucens]CAD7089077.1 unnamed protein product [Hermetia illucens]
MRLFLSLSVLALVGFSLAEKRCALSPTTASGSAVQGNVFCSGDLIFEDNFDWLDQGKWQHEVTLGGGGNWEFQWYVNDRRNSYVQDGVLHIKPTLTSDIYGEGFLTSGTLNLGAECTNGEWFGCERTGSYEHILNPIRSARMRTLNSFSFKYGRIEIRAKLPAGDWLWPAIWMLPTHNVYGIWPRSGEVDIMESRGNRNLVSSAGVPIGPEQVGATMHFGPDYTANGWPTAHFERNSGAGQGFNNDFHRYQVEWAPDHFTFKVDDVELGTVWVGSGFWDRGGFSQNTPWFENPWKNGANDAPFDQQFHIIMNLAVGGINFFPDDAHNPTSKPWHNESPNAMTQFWNGRYNWLSTWNYNTGNTDSHLQVDYVRVWAL